MTAPLIFNRNRILCRQMNVSVSKIKIDPVPQHAIIHVLGINPKCSFFQNEKRTYLPAYFVYIICNTFLKNSVRKTDETDGRDVFYCYY